MSLRNMNIAPRAFLGFAVIGSLMLVLGVFALKQMSSIREAGENVATDSIPSIKNLGEFSELTLRLRVLAYRLLVDRDSEGLKKVLENYDRRNKQLADAQLEYEKVISSPNEQKAYEHFVELLAKYQKLEVRLKALSRENRTDELKTVINDELVGISDELNVVLNQLVQINASQSSASNDQADAQYNTAFTLVVILLLTSTALTVIFAWLLIRSITLPIANALKSAEAIAEGDLSQTITVDGSDEAGRLLLAMSKMQESLRDALQRISGSASQLASAADQLNSVTDESAGGLARQNDEIEQAATAVNEMTCAVEEVARNAVSTSEASKSATATAGDGRDQVQETVSAIDRMTQDVQATATLISNLAEESRDIGKVLDVIRGLADQT
ncbi:methyl-accepting chemotaxis protein, partial [Serratia proteamaculans]|uniref:methyl-accepting chemotaxis protein n=1 Tax=Serratia proteamaculans TaxID=28151 RepID=UPI003CFE5B0B